MNREKKCPTSASLAFSILYIERALARLLPYHGRKNMKFILQKWRHETDSKMWHANSVIDYFFPHLEDIGTIKTVICKCDSHKIICL